MKRPAQQFLRDVVLAYQGDECLIWPFAKVNGYGKIALNGKFRAVSRLACTHRHGPPPTPKHEAAHSCGKGREGCVNPRHLSWKTSSENGADKYVHGTAKLSDADAREIRALRGVMPQAAIAAKFGICQSMVSQVQRYKKKKCDQPETMVM